MQAAAFQVAACIVFYVRTQSRIPAFYPKSVIRISQ